MASDELDAMLVRNLRHANLAYDRLMHPVSNQVEAKLSRVVEAWAKQNGWIGEFQLDDDNVWVAPTRWIVPAQNDGDPSYYAFASFNSDGTEGEGAGADHIWLMSLCGEGRARWGLILHHGDALGLTKARWRRHAATHSAMEQLLRLDYVYDDEGRFIRTVAFSAEALATAIETDDYLGFTKPLHDALNELPQAAAAFDEILSGVKPSST